MLGRMVWTLLNARHHPGWSRRYALIRRIAQLSPEQFRIWHESTVRAHLRWAVESIPWHRARVGRSAELTNFPILTRADVQADKDLLRNPSHPASSMFVESSGGSTGQPVRLWRDRVGVTCDVATLVHVHETWGLVPWVGHALLWGDDRERGAQSLYGKLHTRLRGWMQLNAFEMTDTDMAAFAELLQRRRPELVIGYATALDLFAGFILRERRWTLRPRVVRSSAETLHTESRRRIEAAFGCKVQDFYGSRESPALAAQCPHGGLHVLAHGRKIEVVDERGEPLGPGKPGRVLVTDLTNRAFGLVRYENGDVASWLADDAPCPCGSPYPRLAGVHGRTSDFITTPSGELIHGEWFTHLFYEKDGVERFQVRQARIDDLEVVTVGRAGAVELASILAKIRARVGPGVNVRWRSETHIPVTPSGKRRFTVSAVPFLRGGG